MADELRRHGWRMDGSHHTGPYRYAPFKDVVPTGAFYFLTIRNHWDALTSWWFKMQGQSKEAVAKGMTVPWMKEWLRQHPNYCSIGKKGFKDRLWWFLDIPELYAIMRYETLETDLRALLIGGGFEPGPLSVIGRDSGRDGLDYRLAMPTEVADYIYTTFQGEIDELGYTF